MSLKLLNCTCLTGTSSAFGELLLKNPSHGTRTQARTTSHYLRFVPKMTQVSLFSELSFLQTFFPPVSSTQQRRHIHTQPTTKHWCILSYFLSGLIFTGCSSSETLILISITLKMWRCDLTVILHFFCSQDQNTPPLSLRTDIAHTVVLFVSSALDCCLSRWRLFVSFTFPWIWLDLRIFLTNQVEM